MFMLSYFCHLLLRVFCNWVVLLSSNLLRSVLLPFTDNYCHSQTFNCIIAYSVTLSYISEVYEYSLCVSMNVGLSSNYLCV